MESASSNARSSRGDSRSTALKACVFATGLAGIVAEYTMATLASYLLGDAILNWTLIISLMLFAMGLGSRLSRALRGPLLDTFVAVELTLSVVVAASAPAAYLLSARVEATGLVIYTIACVIGLLIGLELPLVTRLNQRFEELRLNIGSVLEHDYYGALLGGVLFAWVGLPHLGLTYTPLALGAVNLVVASYLFGRYRGAFARPRTIAAGCLGAAAALIAIGALAEPIVRYGEQQKYRDRVVYQEQTRYQRIVMTRFKDHHWLYLDGHQQFSTFDQERYHEPLVHPAMALANRRQRVLIVGGGDGLALREVLKHRDVEAVTVAELDPAITRLATTHPVLRQVNGEAFADPRVEVVHRDGYGYLLDSDTIFDVVIVDLPDPRTVDLARLYSRPFYELVSRHLSPGGVLVTQATSPFFSRRAFLSILATMRAAGLEAVPYHNHVPTMGEWGWVLGQRGPASADSVPAGSVPAGSVADRATVDRATVDGASAASEDATRQGEPRVGSGLRARLMALDFAGIETRFLSPEAMVGMLHFGKGIVEGAGELEVSDEANLAVFYYYRDSDWDLY
ncbi:MAG: polyamine aminopropyltransferase [Acidobacteriota bacterium]